MKQKNKKLENILKRLNNTRNNRVKYFQYEGKNIFFNGIPHSWTGFPYINVMFEKEERKRKKCKHT